MQHPTPQHPTPQHPMLHHDARPCSVLHSTGQMEVADLGWLPVSAGQWEQHSPARPARTPPACSHQLPSQSPEQNKGPWGTVTTAAPQTWGPRCSSQQTQGSQQGDTGPPAPCEHPLLCPTAGCCPAQLYPHTAQCRRCGVRMAAVWAEGPKKPPVLT